MLPIPEHTYHKIENTEGEIISAVRIKQGETGVLTQHLMALLLQASPAAGL